MAYVDDFCSLLDVDAPVDEKKLRRTASAGIPPPLRPHVWNMLLGIVAFDRAQDLSRHPRRLQEYAQLTDHLPDNAQLSRRIRRVLTRSRSAYQPAENHQPINLRANLADDESGNNSPEKSMGNSAPLRVRSTSSFPSASEKDALADKSEFGTVVAPPSRTHRRPVSRIVDTHLVARFARVISTYLENAPAIDYHDHFVFLCAPFLEIMPTEADAYYAFSALMNTHGKLFSQSGLHDAVSNFQTMFRILYPELYDHFVAEEVDLNKWARDWLRGLLVEQLPRRSLLRLWDSYFANPPFDGVLLHPYVCLVFIQNLKPDLHDCEDAESIMAVLSALPAMDIDHVIANAKTKREELCDPEDM